MLFPEVWGRISFRCTHKLHCVFALIDCTRMVQFLTAIPFLFYYYVDDRAVGNRGGGHCVLKWGFTRKFHENQDDALK